jgi:hypothetical protein
MAPANPNVSSLSLKERVQALKNDARTNYNCVIVTNQDYRSPEQAQEFHICHMFLHNGFAKKGILPRHVSKLDGRTIAWEHLADPSIKWELSPAERFLKTASGSDVRRSHNGKEWLPAYKPDRHATIKCMAAFLKKHGVGKQAAPGKNGCGEPCLCGGRASKHTTGAAYDLGGLDKLSKVLDARGGPGKPGNRLDTYLLTFGLWRPMANNPEKTREPWHVEIFPVKHKRRLENVRTHHEVHADYKAILLRHHFHNETSDHLP